MKNKRIEQNIGKAKRLAKTRHFQNNGFGVETETWFEGLDPDKNFLCEFIRLKFGQQFVTVMVSHPRYIYIQAIRDIADEYAGPVPDGDMFGTSTVVYQRAGNSRKRIRYVMSEPDENSKKWDGWFSKYELFYNEIAKGGINYEVPAFIEVKQSQYGRIIELWAPVDIRSEKAAGELAQTVRELLRSKDPAGGLAKLYPGYNYGRQEWLAEMSSGDVEKTENPEIV